MSFNIDLGNGGTGFDISLSNSTPPVDIIIGSISIDGFFKTIQHAYISIDNVWKEVSAVKISISNEWKDMTNV